MVYHALVGLAKTNNATLSPELYTHHIGREVPPPPKPTRRSPKPKLVATSVAVTSSAAPSEAIAVTATVVGNTDAESVAAKVVLEAAHEKVQEEQP